MTNDIAIRFCDEYLARNIADIDKDFLKKAKEALQQEPCEDDKPCTECPKYDHEKHNCPHFCHVIKGVLKEQPNKSEWQKDHEILKAYSDGASAVLDKIKAEIDEQYDRVHPYDISCAEGLEMALNIIDKYKAEGSEKE